MHSSRNTADEGGVGGKMTAGPTSRDEHSDTLDNQKVEKHKKKTIEEKVSVEEKRSSEEKKDAVVNKATNPKGTEGVDLLPYYHGLVPREDMKELLKEDGDFLVRNTELNSGEARTYCMSVRWGGEVRHFAMKPFANGEFSFDGKRYFPIILDMLAHYLQSGEAFSVHKLCLYRSINREEWELLHAQVDLKEKLGNGAFGDVYLGIMYLSDKKQIRVAVKTMRCATQTKDKIEEVMAEARLMRQLDHKNIVKCYGVAADVEPLYIIMEFVKGGSLDKYLIKYGEQLELNERLKMLVDISSAIEYLHDKKKIIHRDIAARNCLYGEKTLKLSDFGLSKMASRIKLGANERAPVRWTAPESFKTGILTKANDIWALGILFWEIFTDGAEPYTGWTAQMVRDQVVINKQHLELPRGVPDPLKLLVKRMFAYDPAERIVIKDVLHTVELILQEFGEESPPAPGRSVKKGRSRSGSRSGGGGMTKDATLKRASAEPDGPAETKVGDSRRGKKKSVNKKSRASRKASSGTSNEGNRESNEDANRPPAAAAPQSREPPPSKRGKKSKRRDRRGNTKDTISQDNTRESYSKDTEDAEEGGGALLPAPPPPPPPPPAPKKK